MRFFLIDRITEWDPGKSATAFKNVALSDDVFQDHFPRRPVMPGVLILEGMAQLAGTLLQAGVAAETGRQVVAVMTVVDRAKFRGPAFPGDTLTYRAVVASCNDFGGKVSVDASIGPESVAEGSITFVFRDVEDPWALEKRREILALWLDEPRRGPHG